MADYGKAQPNAVEAEETVLGALLLEKDAYLEVESILSPEVFYTDAHQLIYQTVQSLHLRNTQVDIITVGNELRSQGDLEKAGGNYYITQLASRISSSANIQTHAYIVYEHYLKRKVIALAADAQKEAFDPGSDALDLVSSLSARAEALADISSVNDEVKSLSDNLLESLQHIENTKITNGVTGVPTGYASLDRITAGFQPGELIVCAGRPGSGKSALSLQLAMNAAELGTPVIFFTLEMSALQVTKRMQSNKSEVPSEKIKSNRLDSDDWAALTNASDQLSRYKIFIDDTPAIPVRKIKSKCRKLKRQGKLGMVVIDYLQLCNGTEATGGKNGLREQEIAFICRAMKNLSKELHVPVLLLSQLNRDVEKRANKEPNTADLRESGEIEQSADIIIFVYRPEMYGILQDEAGMSTAGQAQLIFAKYRDGSPCRTALRFIPSISKFVEWESIKYEEPADVQIHAGANLNNFANLEDEPPF